MYYIDPHIHMIDLEQRATSAREAWRVSSADRSIKGENARRLQSLAGS